MQFNYSSTENAMATEIPFEWDEVQQKMSVTNEMIRNSEAVPCTDLFMLKLEITDFC